MFVPHPKFFITASSPISPGTAVDDLVDTQENIEKKKVMHIVGGGGGGGKRCIMVGVQMANCMNRFKRSLFSMRFMLLRYSLEPRPNIAKRY